MASFVATKTRETDISAEHVVKEKKRAKEKPILTDSRAAEATNLSEHTSQKQNSLL